MTYQMPEPRHYIGGHGVYTAPQVQSAYAAGRAAGLEEAASVCERLWPDKNCSGHEWSDGWADGTCASADAIRNLAKETP